MTKTYCCQNCSWSTQDEKAMHEIRDFGRRHEPGDTVADGQCPECGSLCFAEVDRSAPFKTPVRLEQHGRFISNRPRYALVADDCELIAVLDSVTKAEADAIVRLINLGAGHGAS